MGVLSRMNGWQRLWFVTTALPLVTLGILYPYKEVYGYDSMQSLYRNSIINDLSSAQCSAYINQPIAQLREPPYSTVGGDCWHLYTSRKYAKKDVYPYSLAMYDADDANHKLRTFFEFAAISSGFILTVSALLYFAGFLIAWIRRGFAQPT